MRYSIYIVLPFMLSGCLFNQTSIQSNYERNRKSCQSFAESRIGGFDTPERHIGQKGRNAELVTLFSDCMAKEGWQVATPKRATKSTSTKPAATATQQPAPVPQPAPQQPVQTQATPLTPSSSMPPLRQPVNPNAATYQPATPSNGPTPYYGSGPGRSF
ncbi:MAG: hypothetical protein ACOYJ2_07910 [Rickettsiales bacterium]